VIVGSGWGSCIVSTRVLRSFISVDNVDNEEERISWESCLLEFACEGKRILGLRLLLGVIVLLVLRCRVRLRNHEDFCEVDFVVILTDLFHRIQDLKP